MDELRFDGRVAIVTGAGRGLGREHALALGRRGATVVVNDVADRNAVRTVDEIIEAGGEAIADVHSISDPSAATELVHGVVARFGRLDILLNNAGRGAASGPIADVDDELLHTIVDSHLLGSFFTARAAWRPMVEAGYGRILFTSSGSAIGAAGMPVYSMAKAGLWGLTRALALEGRPLGIVVNALLPMGYTRAASLNPHEDTRRYMEENFPAPLVAPAALALLHERAPCSGELISTGAGRVARVATVAVPGLQAGAELTPELVLDRWDEIVALDGGRAILAGREELELYEGPARFMPESPTSP